MAPSFTGVKVLMKKVTKSKEDGKRMFAKLPNAVPAGENKEDNFTKNHEQATANLYVYANM